MPLWYYEKKDLRNTPSARDGIEPELEARYRREGARFIVDCGTKLGLRYDSCATGVVFFHRFYMFHSFREFHRYVTAACCLFLAGKTEETPKKCKDIIKTTRSMLTEAQFMVFGDDPKEEVMTMERILLQTIKFDLMVEHPYAYLLKFAKMIKSKSDSSTSDKNKVQKLVQMAWTFINDSLCTMLCLQWEPEVIAVSLMYLASRLTKTDITDWQGKPATFRGKWWEFLVEDINQELLEDVCHQVLDLYSSTPQKTAREETPPPPPPKTPHPSSAAAQSTPQSAAAKRPRSPITPAESHRSLVHSTSHSVSGPHQIKVPRDDKHPSPAPSKDHDRYQSKSRTSGGSKAPSRQASVTGPPPPTAAPPASAPGQTNPYVSSAMYSSSFMTQEGSQSIQSLVGGPSPAKSSTAPYPPSQYPPAPPSQPPHPPPSLPPPPVTASSTYPPQSSAYQQPYQSTAYQQPASYQAPTQTTYSQPAATGYTQQYAYPGGQYPQTSSTYPPQPAAAQQHTQQHPTTPQSASKHTTPQPPTSYPQNYPPPSQYPTQQQYSSQYSSYGGQSYQNYAPTQSYQAPQTSQPPPQGPHTPHRPNQNPNSGLSIRLTTRQ